MKKNLVSLLVLVALLPACGSRKKGDKHPKKHHEEDTMTQVDIPVAGGQIRSFFDDDLSEFELADDQATLSARTLSGPETINEYAWVEEEAKKSDDFKAVYFDFDRYGIKKTQEQNIAYDVDTVKKMINEHLASGQAHPDVKVIIEGHACHSAGSALYNLALSEKRAKVVADRLVAAGVSREFVKIVGRGQEIPATVNGKVVTGDRQAQWPNRRAELRIFA